MVHFNFKTNFELPISYSMKNCAYEFYEKMFLLNPQLLVRLLSKLVVLVIFLILPQLNNLESQASTSELLSSLSHESVNDRFPSSTIPLSEADSNSLSHQDPQDDLLFAQASTNIPPIKPVIAIDYARITTPYTPIVHNDDLIRERNPLRFQIKTLAQLRPEVELNLRITQSNNYIEGKPTPVIPPQFEFKNAINGPITYEETITFTNMSTITTFGWRIADIIQSVEGIGTISINLLPGDDYELDPSNRILEYRIDGNFTPIMQVLAEDYSIVEGEPATFQIGWINFTDGGRPPSSSLDVNFTVTQQGDFINGTYPNKINIPNGRTFSTLAIETEDDNLQEANGLINVTLQPGTGYRLISFYTRQTLSETLLDQFDSAYVDIFDNDQPRIAITAEDYTIQEGQTATFKLTTETSAPLNNLLVHVKSTKVGDFFFDEISTSIVIPAGARFGYFEVATINDDVVEDDGSITVAVRSGMGYVVALTHFSVVVVQDNDRLRIGVSSLVDSIVEGETIQFKIWSETIIPTTDLTVKIAINRDGGDFYSQTLPESIVIATGRKSYLLAISTIDDNDFDVDGQISVEILESVDYLVANDHVAVVHILDNDQSIYVLSHQQNIYEGETAQFLIGPDVQPFTKDRIINIDVDFVGNFISSSAPQDFLLPAGARSKLLTFATDTLDSMDSDGSVQVELLLGPGYEVSSRNSAMVTIKDKSKKPPPQLTVFINAQSSRITEGETAIFVIGTDQVRLNAPITVNYQVATSGNYFTRLSEERTLELRNGRLIAGRVGHMLIFGTENDATDETDGSITVTLQTNSNYALMQNYSSAVVSVLDNDVANSNLPVITISPLIKGPIIEGDKAQFLISTSQRPELDLTVLFSISYNYKNFMTPVSTSTEIAAETSSVNYDIDTFTDDEKLPNVTYTVRLLSGNGYTIGGKDSASIVANDNDLEEHLPNPDANQNPDPPTISITASQYFLDENETAKFRIVADYSAPSDLSVSVRLTWTDNLYTGRIEQRIITLPAGNLEQEFDVRNPYEDNVDAADIYVIARVFPGEGYLNSWISSAISIFEDDDPEPKISIGTVSAAPAMEGDIVQFRLSSETAPQENLAVNISLSGATNFLAPTSRSITATLPARSLMGIFEIATAKDQLDEPDGMLIATIQPGVGYSIANEDSATKMIQDNDVPNQPIVSIISNSSMGVTEGTPASFRLNFSPQTPNEITVNYNISGSSNFLSSSIGNDTETVSAGLTTKTFTVATDSDSNEEADGYVVVKLQKGTGYSVGTNDRATVTIRDDDTTTNSPAISISTITSGTIEEGEPARFKLTFTIAPSSELPVFIDVSESGEFISGTTGTRMVKVSAGERGKNFAINTLNDLTDENDGSISVTILDRTGYTLSTYITASVNVRDNDSTPFISILSTNSWGQSINEGDAANFRIYSRVAVSTPLNVSVLIETEGDVSFKGEEIRTIEFPGGHSNKTLDILTVNDEVAGSWGLIRATVISGTGYQVGPEFSDAVKVLDDDSLPIISITTDESSITEGDTAEFELIVSKLPASNLYISVKLSGSANFFAEALNNRIITLQRRTQSVEFGIDTIDDQNYELDGFIRAEVLTGGGYRVPSENDFKTIISISDNDSSPVANLISISAIDQFGVPEGLPANFQLTSSSVLQSDVMVNIAISQRGSFVAGEDFNREIEFKAGTTTKVFPIATDNDLVDEVDGSITVLLQSGQQYSISNFTTATVPVIDNDAPANGPEISIYELTKTITEGEQATFRFVSSLTPEQDIDVLLEIEQIGNFSEEQFGLRTLRVSHQRLRRIPFALFTLQTQNDNVTETPGSIIVTIRNGVGYRVGISSSAVVNILDNDKPASTPTVAITTMNPSGITEGDTAHYQLTSSAPFNMDIDILVKVTGTMRFLQTDYDFNYGDFAREIWPVQLVAGQTQATFTVSTLDDSDYEPDGKITVAIQAWHHYKVGNPSSVTIAVRNNDAEPELSIAVESENGVVEGSPALFTFSSTTHIRRWAHLNVTILVSGTGSYIEGEFGYRTLVTWDFSSILLSSSRPGRFSIDTIDDAIDEADGSVTVTIIDGAGFSVGSNSSATVNIFDNDGKPSVSIFPTSTEFIPEGSLARFRLETATVLESDLEVKVSIAYEGDFVAIEDKTTSRTEQIQAGTSNTEFEIPTVNDEIKELNGQITVTIQSSPNYDVGAFSTSTIVVVDNDEVAFSAPTITLESLSTTGIVEGQNARLKFTVEGTINVSTNIIYSITGPSHIVTNSPIYKEFNATANQTEFFINELFADDQVNEPDGLVTFELYSAPEYNFGSSYRAQVEVRDNDLIPKISIESLATNGVSESERARFRIHSPTASLSDLPINIDISGSENFLLNPQESRTVILPSETLESFFEVATVGNNIDESNGMVLASIQAGTGYTIGSNNQVSVTIMDDDPANPSLPLISIASATTQPVVEGDLVRYKLSTAAMLANDLEINLQVTGSDDLIDAIGKRTVIFPQQMNEKVFEIQTIEDNVSDENAGITITIQVGENYLVGVNDFVTFRVFDDDTIPKLSITPLANTPIAEGEDAWFRISSNSASNTNISIKYAVEDPGNFVVQPFNEWVLLANSVNTDVFLNTIDDKILEPEGVVTVILLSTADYGLSNQVSASVTVQDNEIFPEFSLQVVGSDSVMEGQPINLKLISDHPSLLDIEVSIWLNGTIKFLQESHRFRLIPVPRGTHEVAFTLASSDDLVDRNDGRISISLINGEYYTLGQTKTVNIDITDNDDAPIFSISPVSIHGVAEGESAQFLLSSTTAPSVDTEINLVVNSTGGYLAEGQNPLTITVPKEQTEHVFRVNTNDNDEISEPGTIQVTFQSSNDYNYDESAMAVVEIYDNEGPPVISVQTGAESEINEGHTASFFISALLIHNIDLQVAIEVRPQGEFFNEVNSNKTIMLPTGRKTQIFYVATVDDLANEPDGLVTVLLSSTPDYVIGEHEQATITIKDNDDLPTLSISAENSHVKEKEEGEEETIAQFNIWSTTISQVDMTINFSIKQTGGFQIWRAPRNLTMIAGNRTVSISFPITNDNVYNPEAELTITLQPSSDSTYNLSTNNRATVKIDDKEDAPDPNDPTPENPIPDNQPRISIASAVVNALTQELIGENSPIEVSIVAENPSVELGNPANFVITANQVPTTDQTINILVERVNSEVTERTNEEIVLRAGADSTNYFVNTGSSEFLNANGSISVQVVAGTNYSVPNNVESNTARVAIVNSQEVAVPSEAILQTGEQIYNLMQRNFSESTRNILTQRSNREAESTSSTSFALAGETNLQNIITKSGNLLNESDINWREIIDQTVFEIELNPNQFANQSTILWGQGNNYKFNEQVNSGQNSVASDMFIGQTGFETRLHHNSQLGIATSLIDGTAKYLNADLQEQNSATYQYQKIAVQPYLIWNYAENSSMWLSGTYGTTEMTFHSEQSNFDLGRSTDLSGMIGGINQLFATGDTWKHHNINLGLSWHGSWSEHLARNQNEHNFKIAAGIPQFQLSLHGDYQFEHATASVLAINLDVDSNWGGQNSDSSNSTTIIGGIEFNHKNGWSIAGRGHTSTEFDFANQQWGVGGKLKYDNSANNEGVKFEIATDWGYQYDHNNTSTLTSRSFTTQNQTKGSTGDQISISGDVGYGLGLANFAGVYTPTGSFEINHDGRQKLELGHKLEFDSDLNVEFIVSWKYQNLEITNQIANLRGGIKW